MDKELKQLIESYFAPKESQRIIKLVENNGVMVRDSMSSEYKLTLRGINKLRKAKKLLEYEEIRNIVYTKGEKKALEGTQ